MFQEFKIRPLIGGPKLPLKFAFDKNFKAILAVNIASEWRLTVRDLTQLVQMDKEYSSQGLKILGFPCNQFGKQEPGTPEEIRTFLDNKGVKFPIFEKIEVNGPKAHPAYTFLRK